MPPVMSALAASWAPFGQPVALILYHRAILDEDKWYDKPKELA
jgi:hypothetical protein